MANYSFEYDIWFYHEFIINLVIQFCFSEYAKFFNGVHHSSFSCYMNDVHDVLHRANAMSIVYWVLSETRFSVAILKISEMFLETDFKKSSCLTSVLHVTSRAGYLANPTFFIFTFGLLMPGC